MGMEGRMRDDGGVWMEGWRKQGYRRKGGGLDGKMGEMCWGEGKRENT